MELTNAQIEEFKRIHEKYGCFEGMQDEQIKRIASGVANYYCKLFEVYKKNYSLSGGITGNGRSKL